MTSAADNPHWFIVLTRGAAPTTRGGRGSKYDPLLATLDKLRRDQFHRIACTSQQEAVRQGTLVSQFLMKQGRSKSSELGPRRFFTRVISGGVYIVPIIDQKTKHEFAGKDLVEPHPEAVD